MLVCWVVDVMCGVCLSRVCVRLVVVCCVVVLIWLVCLGLGWVAWVCGVCFVWLCVCDCLLGVIGWVCLFG